MGLLAQEVLRAFPEAVRTDVNGVSAVAHGDMLAPVVQAIKALHARVAALEARLGDASK
jgi:hypothetical protein